MYPITSLCLPLLNFVIKMIKIYFNFYCRIVLRMPYNTVRYLDPVECQGGNSIIGCSSMAAPYQPALKVSSTENELRRSEEVLYWTRLKVSYRLPQEYGS